MRQKKPEPEYIERREESVTRLVDERLTRLRGGTTGGIRWVPADEAARRIRDREEPEK